MPFPGPYDRPLGPVDYVLFWSVIGLQVAGVVATIIAVAAWVAG
jgi:hypothetical protein